MRSRGLGLLARTFKLVDPERWFPQLAWSDLGLAPYFHGAQVDSMPGYHMEDSQNYGYLFGGPHNKGYSILGSILGSPYLGKLPYHLCSGYDEMHACGVILFDEPLGANSGHPSKHPPQHSPTHKRTTVCVCLAQVMGP